MTDSLTSRPQTLEYALTALGAPEADTTLYLDRCQVDTPDALVKRVWRLILEARRGIGKVVDFGAGDGRFSRHGRYKEYVGYEIDSSRCATVGLPSNARIVNACAFSDEVSDAYVVCGNPPFVRNQDLPSGWRQRAAETLERRLGVKVSGLANAWLYFFLLSLASTRADGLIALVLPFEWVSRPSSKAVREYIRRNGWDVRVYRLQDATFDHVLTTSSITIIDKRSSKGSWHYFRERGDATFSRMRSPTGGQHKVLPYFKSSDAAAVAKRGLSPGTQEYLTLTEAQRARCGLRIGVDVIRCVTSLRNLDQESLLLDERSFRVDFVDAGRKCWLVNTSRPPSARLVRYLASVPTEGRQTSTCTNREVWWQFPMPQVPDLLMATGFRTKPKVVINRINAIAVGSVCGISLKSKRNIRSMALALRAAEYVSRIVSHSNGLRKLEINQINALLATLAPR